MQSLNHRALAVLVQESNDATSTVCCGVMSELMDNEPNFNLVTYEFLAFFKAQVIRVLIENKIVRCEADEKEFEEQLFSALGDLVKNKKEFWWFYSLLTMDSSFLALSQYYARGLLRDFNITNREMEEFDLRYEVNPATDGTFLQSYKILLFRLFKVFDFQELNPPGLDKIAAVKLMDMVGVGVKQFGDRIGNLVN
jgi:hypothetical protein